MNSGRRVVRVLTGATLAALLIVLAHAPGQVPKVGRAHVDDVRVRYARAMLRQAEIDRLSSEVTRLYVQMDQLAYRN